jgi:hypothetical protein
MDPVIFPDNKGMWILYANPSCDEVIGFFADRADAEFAAPLFRARSKGKSIWVGGPIRFDPSAHAAPPLIS